MTILLKTHYQVHEYGDKQAIDAWEREGIVPHKVKFCDRLMMRSGRKNDFCENDDDVECKKCQKKIYTWWKNGFDLPT